MQRGKGCGYKGEELGSFVVMADLNYLDHDDGYTKPHVIKLHRATHTHTHTHCDLNSMDCPNVNIL